MKEITESFEYTYRQLRLTKNDIRKIYSLIGEIHVREISIGNYALESIDELDTIEGSLLRQFSLEAVYTNTSPPNSSYTFLSIQFMQHYAKISLNNSDNPEAFTAFHKVHTLLHSKDIYSGWLGYLRYGLDFILSGVVAVIGTNLLMSSKDLWPQNYVTARVLIIATWIGFMSWVFWHITKIILKTTVIYLMDKPPTFLEKHSDGLKLNAVNTIIGGIISLAFIGLTATVTGIIAYNKGVTVGEKQASSVTQQTPASSTTQPTTAPATKPTK